MHPLIEPYFGDCPCGGKFESRVVEVRFHFTNRETLLRDVRQGQCASCGSRVYQTATLTRLDAIYLEGKQADARQAVSNG